MKACKDCVFYAVSDVEAKGQCRRGRPSKEGWPETMATDWCGEFSIGQPTTCGGCKYYIPSESNPGLGYCFSLPPGQRDASVAIKGALLPCCKGAAREPNSEAPSAKTGGAAA